MLTRRTLLKALASLPLLGGILPAASSRTGSCVGYRYSDYHDSPPVFDLKSLPLPIVHSDFFNGKEFSDGMDASRKVLLDHQRQALRLWPDIDIAWAPEDADD